MQDEKIVELYFKRDESALKETEKKYDRYLTKIAFNILNDMEDSKESVNETYFATWNSIPPNRPRVLSAYLSKLTRRISIDIIRKRSAEKRKGSEYALSLEELKECAGMEGIPDEELEIKRLACAINNFLHTLSEDARNLFIGRYYFLDSLKDTAKYCGMSESKAKSMLFRTRCALRDYLKKEGFII